MSFVCVNGGQEGTLCMLCCHNRPQLTQLDNSHSPDIYHRVIAYVRVLSRHNRITLTAMRMYVCVCGGGEPMHMFPQHTATHTTSRWYSLTKILPSAY